MPELLTAPAMSTRSRILKNMASLFVLHGANYLLPLITFPYLVRVIGLEGFGKIAFAASVVQLAVMVTSFAFNQTATQRIATHRDDSDEVSRVFSAVLVFKALLGVSCAAVLIVLVALVPRLQVSALLIAAAYPAVIGEVLMPTWLFLGLERMERITALTIGGRLLTTAMVFLLVRDADDVVVAALLQALPFVLSGVIGLGVARRLGVRFRLVDPFRACRELIMDSARVFLGALPSQIYVRTPMVILGAAAPADVVGRFAVAHRVAGLLTQLVQPVGQALYPWMCRLSASDPHELHVLRRLLLAGLAPVALGAIAALHFLAPWLVRIIGGEDLPGVRALLPWFYPIIGLTMANVLLVTFVLAMRRFRTLARMNAGSALLFLGTALPLTALFEDRGMAAAMLAVETFAFGAALWVAREGQGQDRSVGTAQAGSE